MPWNQALQGLLGGLTSGVDQFVKNREMQAEVANREKLTQLQADQERRMQQAQEWEKLHTAYQAANPEMDFSPEQAQTFAAGGLPVFKTPEGGMRRPYSVSESSQIAQRKLAELGITDKERAQAALLEMQNNPALQNAPQHQLQRFMLSRGLTDDVSALPTDIQAKAQAEYAPRLAGELQLANINNAADLQQTQMQTDAQRFTANRMYDRVTEAAGMKPMDSAKFNEWYNLEMFRNPKFKQALQAAQANGTVAEFQKDAAMQYRNLFGVQQ